tara:strand:- start:477 stop:1001 length:525 start_codon:yes stop_codon:yes gene_type:complete
MKRNTLNLFVLGLAGVLAFSCSNKELESRIAKLEGKVAELETSGKPLTPAAKPVAEAEPDVKPEGPLPSFEFAELDHDFGSIKEGDVVEHTFKFKNTGDAPLIISSATASCGCTVPDWPKEPIPVGEEGEIQVRFNSAKKPGVQNKTITITANTYPKINRLRIKANVAKADNPS